MRVVSNTSPLCNLAVIGRLHLLHERYAEITVPLEVWSELSRLGNSRALAEIKSAHTDGWLHVHTLGPDQLLAFNPALDPGEAAAISLAKFLQADLLLMDELRGRTAARARGLTVAGLLGELLHARRHRKISSLQNEISLLRQRAGFFIKSDLEQYLLREAGEI